MKHFIPDDVMRHVIDASPTQAAASVLRFDRGDPNKPGLIIVINANALGVLLDMFTAAIAAAPDPDLKAAWTGLSFKIVEAIQGSLPS